MATYYQRNGQVMSVEKDILRQIQEALDEAKEHRKNEVAVILGQSDRQDRIVTALEELNETMKTLKDLLEGQIAPWRQDNGFY